MFAGETQLLSSGAMTVLYLGTEGALGWWRLSQTSGQLPQLDRLGELDVGPMPSFMAFSRRGPWAVALVEGGDAIVSLDLDDAGALRVTSRKPCPGGPAYISLSADERWALVASYGSGELRVYPVTSERQLGPCASTTHTGKYSHCAWLDADLGVVYVPSKGTDTVFVGSFDHVTGRVSEVNGLKAPLGSGPRHLVMAPDATQLYLANENDCSLMVVHRKAGERPLTPCVQLSALPRAQLPHDSGADVHVSRDGRFIYMSVRGHDSIAVFARRGDEVECIQHVSTRGRTPRNFCLLGDELLIVANQDSKNVAFFCRDQATGSLTFLNQVEIGERPFWVGNPQSH
jgi:6-phosphogluconolactonase